MDRAQREVNRIPLNPVARLVDRWLDYWHWTKRRAPNQFQTYRCKACTSIVTWRHIHQNGGCKCGSARISPTMPLFTEKFRLLLLPWTV